MIRYVGLDVHKRSVEACIIDAHGNRQSRHRIDCRRDELRAFAQQHLQPTDHVALEATTNTWAVVDCLEPHVARVVVGNPLKIKAIAEAKVKTDKIDAHTLAQLLRCGYLPEVWHPDQHTRQLRKLTTARAAVTGDQTRCKNRIHAILTQLLIEPPVSTLFSKAGLQWLKQVELPEDDRLVIDGQLRLLETLQQEIQTIDHTLARWAHERDQVRLLMTLPGFGYAVAQALWAAIGDLSRFNDGDHLASYLGWVPSTYRSARRCHHGSITKAGRSHARWMLTQAAQQLDSHPGPLGVFFRKLSKKKSRNIAIVATARKLATIAYLMLKENQPYRYALPGPTQKKLSNLAYVVPGVRRKPTRVEGIPRGRRQPGTRARNVRSLPDVCEREGLPSPPSPHELPAGEQRMLKDAGVEKFNQQLHQPQQKIERKRSRKSC